MFSSHTHCRPLHFKPYSLNGKTQSTLRMRRSNVSVGTRSSLIFGATKLNFKTGPIRFILQKQAVSEFHKIPTG